MLSKLDCSVTAIATTVSHGEAAQLQRHVQKLESDIQFLEREHAVLLQGLQRQVERLREDNQELQFQLVMRSSRNVDGKSEIRPAGKGQELQLSRYLDERVPIAAAPAETSVTVAVEIVEMRRQLQEETQKNRELQNRLNLLEQPQDNFERKIAVSPTTTTSSSYASAVIEVAPDIRVSLQPFRVALLSPENGQFLSREQPSVDDCKVVIKRLLSGTYSNSNPTIENTVLPQRKLDAKVKIGPTPTSLAPLRLVSMCAPPRTITSDAGQLARRSHQQQHTPLTTATGLTNPSPQVCDQTDVAIMSLGPDIARLQHLSSGSASAIGQQQQQAFSMPSLGVTLPALLPRSGWAGDHQQQQRTNQAERHRRLQAIQKRRLDQYDRGAGAAILGRQGKL